VEIRLVGDEECRRYNRDYLGRDRPTNVISFPTDEAGEWGQLLVNVDYALRQSDETGYGLLYLVGYYILHGLLHLTGYDHERVGSGEAARMNEREEALRDLLLPLLEHEDGQ
jgi:probable rRNA maturation factor